MTAFIDKWTPTEIALFQQSFQDWAQTRHYGRLGDFDAAMAFALGCPKSSIRKLRKKLRLALVTVQ